MTLRKSTQTRREISNVIAEFNIQLKNETIGYNVHGDRVKPNSVEHKDANTGLRHPRRRRHRRRYRLRYNGKRHNCPRCKCKANGLKRKANKNKRNIDNNRSTITPKRVHPPALGCRIGVGILPVPL